MLKQLKTIDRESIRVFIPNHTQSQSLFRQNQGNFEKKTHPYLYKIHSLEGSWICFKPLLLDWTDEWQY